MESMTLNLAQRSFKVIDFGANRKRVYVFLLVVNSNLEPILHRFRYIIIIIMTRRRTAVVHCDDSPRCPRSSAFCHICLQLAGVPSPTCCIHVFRVRPGGLRQLVPRDTVAWMSKIDNFPYPTPIPAKIRGVPFGVDPSCWDLLRVKWID